MAFYPGAPVPLVLCLVSSSAVIKLEKNSCELPTVITEYSGTVLYSCFLQVQVLPNALLFFFIVKIAHHTSDVHGSFERVLFRF